MKYLTPLQIHVMIHIYYVGVPFYPQGPGYWEAIRVLTRAGLLREELDSQGRHSTTDAGDNYVARLREVPLS